MITRGRWVLSSVSSRDYSVPAHRRPIFGPLAFRDLRGKGQILASSLLSCPDHWRMRSSAVTRLWPSRAVATMIRSAGSPCNPVRRAALAAMTPLTGISAMPSRTTFSRQESRSCPRSSLPFWARIPASQKDMAEIAALPLRNAVSTSPSASRPSLRSPVRSQTTTWVSRSIKKGPDRYLPGLRTTRPA